MAFHVACPITCRKICYCSIGACNGGGFEEVAELERFLKDPWLRRARERDTIQVQVPRVVAVVAAPKSQLGDGGGDAEEEAAAQRKRAVLQKKAVVSSFVAEDYARRFESGDFVDSVNGTAGEELIQSNAKILCRLCFRGDNEGSDRARKMLSCKTCGKKYHRNCLKSWAQHRDLFHWSSWTCPSCRICEACRRTGDPNKFTFCKRCDAAYHCYCMQPPHKNVSSGPYLCPKHTRCHSCNSSVPGNGLSVRWFLGYTCCDACGRLFVKGNYCPVCLKVYRDSESTPMVCCDICQRWVHCQCDGISDEKYLQFQVDGNLQYACPTCRGDCYPVRNLEEAVQELWRRKDEDDKDLIASLRAAAGLPTQEEIFSISPFSDDEESPVVPKNEYGRSLKFSLKGLSEKSPKKSKEYGKKSSNKKHGKNKGYQRSSTGQVEEHSGFEGHNDAPSAGCSTGDITNEEMRTNRSGEPDCTSAIAGSLIEGICSINHAGVGGHKFVDGASAKNGNRTSRIVKMKGSKHHSTSDEDDGTNTNTAKTTKGPKIVIHLGSSNKNVTASAKPDASSCHREKHLATSNGIDDQHKLSEYTGRKEFVATGGKATGHRADPTSQTQGQKVKGKEGHLIKIKKPSPEIADSPTNKIGQKRSVSPLKPSITVGKRSINKVSVRHAEAEPDVSNNLHADGRNKPQAATHSVQKDPKPLLKLKFKNPYPDSQNAALASIEDEKGVIKGQRSKRKRLSLFGEKSSATDNSQRLECSSIGEMMDANWILQKLGKEAIGKRVEIRQQSDDTTWHRGKVTEFFEATSVVAVTLDNGETQNIELGKQGIRFVPQKLKR